MWQFRFPTALLSYVKEGSTQSYQMAIEKAREYAKPIGKTRYNSTVGASEAKRPKRPTLTEAEAYIAQIIEDDKTLAERNIARERA